MPNPLIMPSRCAATIDLSALVNNAGVLRSSWGSQRALMAVVKADAYGHGLQKVSEALIDEVDMFGVASVSEAQQLQVILQDQPKDVFLLGAVLPSERALAVQREWLLTVSNEQEARVFDQLAKQQKKRARVHLAVDTGMGRIGVGECEFESLLQCVKGLSSLSVEGVMSHFPSADDEDRAFTLAQIERFKWAVEKFKQHFPDARHVHIANSAGLLRFSHVLGFTNLARPGLALYGVAPTGCSQGELKPVMSLKTEIALLRKLPPGQCISYGRRFITSRDPSTRVATLAVGYGDGYLRQLSGCGAQVLIAGQRCPVLGTVTMDQIMVDVTEVTGGLAPGDEAVLIGHQLGQEITAAELAEKGGTISWQVLTGISKRVDRDYLKR